MVYDVKPNLTHKSRLICDGSRVNPWRLPTRAIIFKGVPVRLLDLITDSQNLKVLQDDIGNAFVQAHTNFFSPSVDLNLVIEQVQLL